VQATLSPVFPKATPKSDYDDYGGSDAVHRRKVPSTELSGILRTTGRTIDGLRFRSGGRPLAAFHLGTGGFAVQIIIGQAQHEEALQLRLGAKVRDILINARAFTEGRWLFIHVDSEQDCRDVQRLLRVRVHQLVPFVVNEKYRLRVCFAYTVFPVLMLSISCHIPDPSFSLLRSARTTTGSKRRLDARRCSRYFPFLRAKLARSSS
jgi:hypothetical protein